MSICTFIASDIPLPEYAPLQDYAVEIDVDRGVIYDGGGDDNYCLIDFPGVKDYTDKNYGVYLEWNYTDGRAKQIIAYIKAALEKADTVEFWHVWLMDYYEFEDRPYIHRRTISRDALTEEHIQEINNAQIWNAPDQIYTQRPSFYCLSIVR